MIRSIGMSSHFVNQAMLSASGLPVPFSIRDSVDAETLVWSATSRKLRASSSRRRRIARPNSSVLINDFAARGIGLVLLKNAREPYHRAVLDARFCFTDETLRANQHPQSTPV